MARRSSTTAGMTSYPVCSPALLVGDQLSWREVGGQAIDGVEDHRRPVRVGVAGGGQVLVGALGKRLAEAGARGWLGRSRGISGEAVATMDSLGPDDALEPRLRSATESRPRSVHNPLTRRRSLGGRRGIGLMAPRADAAALDTGTVGSEARPPAEHAARKTIRTGSTAARGSRRPGTNRRVATVGSRSAPRDTPAAPCRYYESSPRARVRSSGSATARSRSR